MKNVTLDLTINLTRTRLLINVLVLFIVVYFGSAKAFATGFETLPEKQFNVLLFTKTSGWHHKSILDGVLALQDLAKQHHFNVIWHEESHYFNDDYLKNVDVVIFLSTTGEILNKPEKQAFERYIQSGKGFVGIHSASDTEYEWPWYQKLVGRTFLIHPQVQTANLEVENRSFPGLSQMPDKMLWTDEWYEFTEANTTKLTYILKVDESSYNPKADWGDKQGEGMGDFHPISWYQYYDGGRSFYTALGHIAPVYNNPLFLNHIYGGIYWAATSKGIIETADK